MEYVVPLEERQKGWRIAQHAIKFDKRYITRSEDNIIPLNRLMKVSNTKNKFMFLLGYDIGSSSVKVSLVNAETGKCVSSAFFPKTETNIIAVSPGWAEQDPESWWENLKLSTSHYDRIRR